MQDATSPLKESDLSKSAQTIKTVINDFSDAAAALEQHALLINSTFTQGRQRIVELKNTLADTTPNIVRLGGSIQDVSNTITDIAKASNRNVIENSENVVKLFSASKLLGQSVEKLSEGFLDVGVSIRRIPEELENSMEYVRSIGGNTREVMKDVASNMEKMNRFQFENGVQGLTKMAAQSSMLRFSMTETFNLAENVLDPDKAIEVASAFQRLGVSAGNLVDPFQLMNLSINDPSGLQNSLAEVSKQFTYFDEKTQSFKINPQGVLTLREMEKSAGLTAGSLSKMALAKSDLDKRLSEVSKVGLSFKSEEDKQFLANISRYKEGELEIAVKNEQDETVFKKISDIQQKDFNKLIDEQKKQPKNLEEIQRSQLDIQKDMDASLRAIKEQFFLGTASAKQVSKGVEDAKGIVTTTFGTASTATTTKEVRAEAEQIFTSLGDFVDNLLDPSKSMTQSFEEVAKKMKTQFDDIQSKVSSKVIVALEDIAKQNESGSKVQQKYSEIIRELIKGTDFLKLKNVILNQTTNQTPIVNPPTNQQTNPQTNQSGLSDYQNRLLQGAGNPTGKISPPNVPEPIRTSTQNYSVGVQKIELVGDMNVKVDFSDSFNQLDPTELNKALSKWVGSQSFELMLENALKKPKYT
jgi:hypothetical protein